MPLPGDRQDASPRGSEPQWSDSELEEQMGLLDPDDGGEQDDEVPTPSPESLEFAGKTFDPKYRDPFFGLLHIGALSDEFYWLGHRFVIKTLNVEDLLVVGRLVKDYQGTLGETKAYTAAIVALATESVDDQLLPSEMGQSDPFDLARKRLRVVLQWYPSTIDAVYLKWMALDEEVQKVVAEMGNTSG